ncbi:MAG TPA: FkbM family methyltransferase [Patescibacteria group bacterium]|jgi:FkbM family methyltransferase|nr:FkbM family methyltransferase [Patescibacteria group bacterium]
MSTSLKNYIFVCLFLFFNALQCKIIGLIFGQNDAPFLRNVLHSVSQCVDAIVYLDNHSIDESVALVKAEACVGNVVSIIKNSQSSATISELYQQLLDEGRKQGGTHFLLLHADELPTASIVVDGRLKKIISQLKSGESLSLPLIFMEKDYRSYFKQEDTPYLCCAFADNRSSFYEQTTVKRIPSDLQGIQWYWQEKELNGLMVIYDSRLKKEVLEACRAKVALPNQTMISYNQHLLSLQSVKNQKVLLAPYSWLEGYESFFLSASPLLNADWHEDVILQLCRTHGIDFFIDIAMWDLSWCFFNDKIFVDSTMKSQYRQDQFLYTYFFSNQQKGFFVDIGAHDGIKWSNSYFFEKKLGWQGLCIEPLCEAFCKLKENRSALCINTCVGKYNGVADFFNVHGAPDQLSGLVNTYHPLHKQRMEREVKEDNGSFSIEKVSVCTLSTLFDQYNIKYVDFISLDTEGSEMDILQGIDFEKVYIKVMTIENMFYGDQLKNFMAKKGFQLVARLGNCDDVYVNKKNRDRSLDEKNI